ncbi:hypothetical protein CHELA17_20469 [Chelatococcus asaccharovorans]|nr:hypothetical protein CHELA17_20469 [Chelatococcus asaccharovorans]
MDLSIGLLERIVGRRGFLTDAKLWNDGEFKKNTAALGKCSLEEGEQVVGRYRLADVGRYAMPKDMGPCRVIRIGRHQHGRQCDAAFHQGIMEENSAYSRQSNIRDQALHIAQHIRGEEIGGVREAARAIAECVDQAGYRRKAGFIVINDGKDFAIRHDPFSSGRRSSCDPFCLS